MKIAVLVGSLRKNSFNNQLAQALERLAIGRAEFEYVDINLPLLNEDLEKQFPPEVSKLKESIETTDGVLFVTPEYNRGVSGVLKNAIDWATRPSDSNSFKGKPAGVVGASTGPVGTAVAQATLQHTLTYLDMKVLGQPQLYVMNAARVFDDEGEVSTDDLERFKKYIDAFIDWVEEKK